MLSKISAASLAASVVDASYSGHGGYGSDIYYQLKDDCSNFNDHTGCTDGQQTRYPDDYGKRAFQTFLKDGVDSHMYRPEYEGLGRVMCFNNVVYSSDKSSATVTATCRKQESITKMEYNWNGAGFTENDTFAAGSDL